MWISILNYNSGQVEFHDISEYENIAPTENEIVDYWLSKEGYNPNNISYMITNDAPEIYDGNTQNIIDMPL